MASNNKWLIPVVIVAAIAVAAGAYLYLGQGDSAPTPTAPGPVAPAPTPTPPAEPAVKPGTEARALIKKLKSGEISMTMDAVHDKALAWRESGKGTDAHLLYFYAARNGHVQSMVELAGSLDPLHFVAGESAMDEPVASQAYKWYARAAKTGDSVANERLDALKAWVEKTAAAGDEDAKLLLMRWK
ncbi:MAG: deoxyribonuclease [Gammaproteobacteria bacterium]